MKRILMVLMMMSMVIPSFGHGPKGKKRLKRKHRTEVSHQTHDMSAPIRPIHRERWVERSGDVYVIVSRTTVTEEDYLKIRNSNRDRQ